MKGAIAHNRTTGAATGSAAALTAETMMKMARASAGLALISVTKVRVSGPKTRAAVAAAVSHSSRRRRVNTRRTSVRAMAWSIEAVVLARKTICSVTRAMSVFTSPQWTRETARFRRPRASHTAASALRSSSGISAAASATSVQIHAGAGSTVQASSSAASVAGAIRLRRRLSKSFQREMSGSRLRSSPPRIGTTGKSHHSSCQSPRTQRCSRRVWASMLEG